MSQLRNLPYLKKNFFFFECGGQLFLINSEKHFKVIHLGKHFPSQFMGIFTQLSALWTVIVSQDSFTDRFLYLTCLCSLMSLTLSPRKLVHGLLKNSKKFISFRFTPRANIVGQMQVSFSCGTLKLWST